MLLLRMHKTPRNRNWVMTHTTEKPVAGVKDLDKLPGALSFYRFAAWVTGLLLLALAVEMVAKYGFGREVEMLGPNGFLTLTPTGEVRRYQHFSRDRDRPRLVLCCVFVFLFPRLVKNSVAVLAIPVVGIRGLVPRVFVLCRTPRHPRCSPARLRQQPR